MISLHLLDGVIESICRISNSGLAEGIAADTCVNVMSQYQPGGKVTAEEYGQINCAVTMSKYLKAIRIAQDFGLRLDQQNPMEKSHLD